MAQILQGLSYKVCSTMLPTFLYLYHLFYCLRYLPLYTNSLLLRHEDTRGLPVSITTEVTTYSNFQFLFQLCTAMMMPKISLLELLQNQDVLSFGTVLFPVLPDHPVSPSSKVKSYSMLPFLNRNKR